MPLPQNKIKQKLCAIKKVGTIYIRQSKNTRFALRVKMSKINYALRRSSLLPAVDEGDKSKPLLPILRQEHMVSPKALRFPSSKLLW